MAEEAKNKASASKFRTSIGGQALIEGVLMRGPGKQAIVVRSPDGLVEADAPPSVAPLAPSPLPAQPNSPNSPSARTAALTAIAKRFFIFFLPSMRFASALLSAEARASEARCKEHDEDGASEPCRMPVKSL